MNCSSSGRRPLEIAKSLEASKCCQCQPEYTPRSISSPLQLDACPFLLQVPTYSTALAVAHSHQSPHPTGGDYCIPTLFDTTIAFIQAPPLPTAAAVVYLKPNPPLPRRQDQLLRRQPTTQTSSNHSSYFFWFSIPIDTLIMLFIPVLKSL